MKWILLMLVFFLEGLFAEEMEVRSYRIEQGFLWRAYQDFAVESKKDDLLNDSEGEWLGELVKKMPFESRFLDGVESARDCTKVVGKILWHQNFKGQAVYVEKEGVLVLRSEEAVHEIFGEALGRDLPRMIRTEVSIYSVPEVIRERRSIRWEDVPEGAELLTELSCVSLPGLSFVARSADGAFKMKGEVHLDINDYSNDYADVRASWTVDLPEVQLSWKTGLHSFLGTSCVHEVGSLDGERTVLAVVKTELVLMDGGLMDEWILKEEGGAFLLTERLASLESLGQPEWGKEGEFRWYVMPPTMVEFLSIPSQENEGDPFAPTSEKKRVGVLSPFEEDHPELAFLGGRGFVDFKKILKENGIGFREKDFVVLHRPSRRLYAKLSESNHELLFGIVVSGCPDVPRGIWVDFLQVELDSEGEGWRPGAGKVLQKMGVSVLPGQTGAVTFGEHLAFEVEAQIDSNDEMVEMRVVLSELGQDLEKASFKTGMVLQNGVSALIQESVAGGKRTAWIVRGSIVEAGELLGEGE